VLHSPVRHLQRRVRRGEQLRLFGGVPTAGRHRRVVPGHAGRQLYRRHDRARETRSRHVCVRDGPGLGTDYWAHHRRVPDAGRGLAMGLPAHGHCLRRHDRLRCPLYTRVVSVRDPEEEDGTAARADREPEPAVGPGYRQDPQPAVCILYTSPSQDADLPIVFLLSAYAATVYSYAYLCFTTFTRIFKDQYGFSSEASGLATVGLGVGFVVGLFFCGAVSDSWSAYLTKKNGGVTKPEYRLPTLVAGAVFVPIGLFWYGWTAEHKNYWIVPIIGTAFIGIGIVTAYVSSPGIAWLALVPAKLINPAQTTSAMYLVDAYTVYSASVMAASTIFRCLFGALLPLAGSAMFDALGVGWGNSVLGFISLAFLPLPFIFYFYGERIRKSQLFKMEF
jgi:hypothetical protein